VNETSLSYLSEGHAYSKQSGKVSQNAISITNETSCTARKTSPTLLQWPLACERTWKWPPV